MIFTLYLMSQKGYEVLKALVADDYSSLIGQVLVGRDKNISDDFADQISDLCKENHILCHERKESYVVSTPYSAAVSWRWLIPVNGSKLIILHDSLLPKYRGFAPLVSMLINKEPRIGVSAIFASEEYDRGDIIFQSSANVVYPLLISEAISIVSGLYVELILKIFETVSKGIELKAAKQDEKLATYSLWLDEDDYLIDWKKSSDEILRFINSTGSPYKNASSYIGSKKIRIKCAEIFPDVVIENRTAGKVIFKDGGYPVVVCGKGLLKLTGVADDETGESLLPVKELRIRFTGRI
jgi:methionyl-tRNA formyltransferase